MESPNKCRVNSGFTLVELSIVMIIIGLLIGGIFGGMKLVENAQVSKTIQDFKSIESAALTFKDTYRALPGDIRSPSTKLSNCTDSPCATGGDGNRILGTPNVGSDTEALTMTAEKFTFWHHLQAANLLQMNYRNTTDMNFGEGQPDAAIGGGFRINRYWQGAVTAVKTCNCHNVRVADVPFDTTSTAPSNLVNPFSCELARKFDVKIDDSLPRAGKIIAGTNCLVNPTDESTGYGNTNTTTGIAYYFGF